MNNPTASKQYVLPTVFTPGDIISGSFTDTGDGTTPSSGGIITIHYYKLGNVYFGFNAYTVTSGQVNMVLGPRFVTTNPNDSYMNDVVNRVCSKLGITEAARGVGYIYSGTPRLASYNTVGATWTQSNGNETIFLSYIVAN